MRSLARLRPSPSMAVALLALFIALGGVSYAVATIDSSDIVNGSIKSKDIKNQNHQRQADVKLNTLVGKNILNNTIRTEDIDIGNGTSREHRRGQRVAEHPRRSQRVALRRRRLQRHPHRPRHRRGHARPGELRGQRTDGGDGEDDPADDRPRGRSSDSDHDLRAFHDHREMPEQRGHGHSRLPRGRHQRERQQRVRAIDRVGHGLRRRRRGDERVDAPPTPPAEARRRRPTPHDGTFSAFAPSGAAFDGARADLGQRRRRAPRASASSTGAWCCRARGRPAASPARPRRCA